MLSVISPWDRSRVVHFPRSVARLPRPPAPPPPPRRHSDPNSASEKTEKHRRYSDIKHPASRLDLRQELQNLNPNSHEFDGWLGAKFDEKDERVCDNRFIYDHDVPLQRSISLDGGVEIFNYLQSLGSDWSGSSVGSAWTIHSEDRDKLTMEQYRSFEDIPASPIKGKSRRASSDVDNAFFGRNLALSVLRDSFKGVETNNSSFSPQIKKLQRCYTTSGSFEDFGLRVSSRNSFDSMARDVSQHVRRISSTSVLDCTKDGYSKERSSQVTFSHSYSDRRLGLNEYEDEDYIEMRVPYYRSISVASSSDGNGAGGVRRRRVGVFDSSFPGIVRERNLRMEVMKKGFESKSCDNLPTRRVDGSGCRTTDPAGTKMFNGTHKCKYSDLRMSANEILDSIGAKETCVNLEAADKVVPAIVVTDADCTDGGVAKAENMKSSTSNLVSRNCDCRICTEAEDVEGRCFLRKMLSKLFVKMVLCSDYGRKLTYWDENNNMNENEMYTCFTNILKLMLGLWLRHLDHN